MFGLRRIGSRLSRLRCSRAQIVLCVALVCAPSSCAMPGTAAAEAGTDPGVEIRIDRERFEARVRDLSTDEDGPVFIFTDAIATVEFLPTGTKVLIVGDLSDVKVTGAKVTR